MKQETYMQWQMRINNGEGNSKDFCIPPVYGPEICINSTSSEFRISSTSHMGNSNLQITYEGESTENLKN